MALLVEFCGERYEIDENRPFLVGREGDLQIDDNLFLHRRFLSITRQDGFWVLSNVGDRLAATVSDHHGRMEAFLPPEMSIPLVFASTRVAFAAGSTVYDFVITNDEISFRSPSLPRQNDVGETTRAPTHLTPDQRRLVLALAEPQLRSNSVGPKTLPASKVAAQRLGWTMTKFNRKLDNVCAKLTKLGVSGLHGSEGDLASHRRSRLVEYALATQLVSADELSLLDASDEVS